MNLKESAILKATGRTLLDVAAQSWASPDFVANFQGDQHANERTTCRNSTEVVGIEISLKPTGSLSLLRCLGTQVRP